MFRAKKWISYLVVLSTILSMPLSLSAQASLSSPIQVNASPTYQVDAGEVGKVSISEAHTEVTASQLGELLNSTDKEQTLLISTDSEAVVLEALKLDSNPQKADQEKRLVLLGELDEKAKKKTLLEHLGSFKNHVVDTLKTDKIGVAVITFNTAYESFVWMHATQYTPQARAAQVIFATLNALVFSLNRTTWQAATERIKSGIFKVLKITEASPWADFTGDFAANLVLSTAIQSFRMSFLDIDRIRSLPELMPMLGSTFLLSLGFTFSGFAWSQLNNKIRESEHPAAIFIAQRFLEGRSVLMGKLASSSKLLQPGTYGFMPWVSLGVSGTLGLLAFIKRDRVTEWLQRNLEKIPAVKRMVPMRCEAIFAL